MVTNVTSLLKTVKAVEDEATRGTRALEATIECIKQELTVRAAVTQLLCQPGTKEVRNICLFAAKTGKLFVPFFSFYYLDTFFPSCFPLRSWRFLSVLI